MLPGRPERFAGPPDDGKHRAGSSLRGDWCPSQGAPPNRQLAPLLALRANRLQTGGIAMAGTTESTWDHGRIIKVPKRNGEYRTIYAPDPETKTALRAMAGKLTTKADRACPAGVAHAFLRRRSPITNAQAHVGHQYTITMDLQDFFDSVTPERVAGKISKEEAALVFVHGAARQGLPTSPAVANLAAADMDRAILRWIERASKQVVYSRYADDLAFSFDDAALVSVLPGAITDIVKRCGFAINERKTRVQWAGAGRRHVTGLAVDDHGVHPTRETKRRLRAAQHRAAMAAQCGAKEVHIERLRDRAAGLAEWAKCKPPSERRAREAAARDVIEALCRAWRLTYPAAIRRDGYPPKILQDQDLGGDCIITTDPAYFLGMSTFTSGWTSCMRQPDGQYRKGVWFWLALPGTSIAAYRSAKTGLHGGIERRVMRARALVHILRDGTRVYDRLYGASGDTGHLRERLEVAGFVQVAKAGSGARVMGHVDARVGRHPYFDSLRQVDGKTTSGRRIITAATR